jgi:broad specificity phosphatase PhoE
MQCYDNIDLNKEGELDAVDLQRALATCDLHFSLAVVADMIRYCDRALLCATNLVSKVTANVSQNII